MRPPRVGITVSGLIEDGVAALWASGVHQNAVFLGLLLRDLPGVEFAGLLTHPSQATSPLAAAFDLPSRALAGAIDDVDVLIELGVRAERDLMIAFRARGGKLVSYMAGNAMVMNLEAVANKSAYGEVLDHAGFDAVWITPQHWRMNRSYAALTRSANVEVAPHIWHPCVVELLARQSGVRFEWRPPEGAWRIGVFEPTVNVLKTFHLPALVCEEAYRRAPERIARVLLFGVVHLTPNTHFQEFCGALSLTRDGRLFAEGRFPLVQVLGPHVDAVVAHQWENALNYLYWDVLYGGFPLVHNSPDIADAGYYYPAFDTKRGGAVLSDALAQHASGLDAYRARARQTIARFRIDNDEVKARYASLIAQVIG
jgi:hypothetical protein